MTRHGPRILFKTDDQSSIGRGAVTYGGHFRPEMAKILWAVAKAGRRWNWEEIIVSEGHRDIRDTRDLHKELRAFDFVCHEIEGDEARRHSIYKGWRDATNTLLDDSDYQIIVHGEGGGLHMHIELDP